MELAKSVSLQRTTILRWRSEERRSPTEISDRDGHGKVQIRLESSREEADRVQVGETGQTDQCIGFEIEIFQDHVAYERSNDIFERISWGWLRTTP